MSKSDKNVYKHLSYLFTPFLKSAPPIPLLCITYWFSKKLSIHNEKWYLQLCNLLFPVRCCSQNCNLVQNTLRQGSKHNPTSQFCHLNLIQVNTQPTLHFGHLNCILVFFLWNTHNTAFICFLWPVITILHYELAGRRGWSSPWGGLRSKHPSTSCKPVD
jgi:hypothetical protein